MLETRTDIPPEVRRMIAEPEKLARGVSRRACFAAGAATVRFVRNRFRKGGTTKTRTAVRSGRLKASYTHKVNETQREINVDVGLLKGSARGKALIYGRVHEGVDHNGNDVKSITIYPKKAGGVLAWDNLPGGGGRAGIVRKGRKARKRTKDGVIKRDNVARSVTIPARPAVRHPRTGRFLILEVARQIEREWAEVLS